MAAGAALAIMISVGSISSPTIEPAMPAATSSTSTRIVHAMERDLWRAAVLWRAIAEERRLKLEQCHSDAAMAAIEQIPVGALTSTVVHDQNRQNVGTLTALLGALGIMLGVVIGAALR